MEFFQTGMGRKFYESSVPKLIQSIEKLAGSVDAINTRLATHEGPKVEESLSIDLGYGVVLKATKKGSKDDYPGFWIDIEIDGESHPFVTAEKVPQKEGDGFVFSAAVWSEMGKEDATHIVKSRHTFSDVVKSALID